jgi:4'-phosphopantetheinyl transferase EntD
MGLIKKQELETDCLLGIWEIREDYNTLLSHLNLDKEDLNALESFRNQERKLEFLSVRSLLKDMTTPLAKIIYNGSRKPYLRDNSFNISITHSNLFTSIILSRGKRVGIDMEYMTGRIDKVAHKFIGKDEFITDEKEYQRYHLYIHWCAKEALYKLCNKPRLIFREDLIISPFQIDERGTIHAKMDTGQIMEEFDLHYFKHENYIIVWCCKA